MNGVHSEMSIQLWDIKYNYKKVTVVRCEAVNCEIKKLHLWDMKLHFKCKVSAVRYKVTFQNIKLQL